MMEGSREIPLISLKGELSGQNPSDMIGGGCFGPAHKVRSANDEGRNFGLAQDFSLITMESGNIWPVQTFHLC